jgi:hypothetical protein
MQILLRIGVREHAMIDDAMRYLLDSYDEGKKGWDIVPKEVDRAPRAIWWEYGAFKDLWGNPNAEIVGYLNLFPSADGAKLASRLNAHAVEYLRDRCERNEVHEMACYLRYAETLPSDALSVIDDKLEQFVDNCITRNPDERQGYGGYPLLIVDSQKSRYYKKYEEVIPRDLDELIANQGEDGTWSPNWTWGRYEETWEVAKKDWQGIFTLNALRTLRSFGRI